MNDRSISIQELKLTAAIYAKIRGVVQHIRETGKLPETIDAGGAHIGANILIRERGRDITLSEDKQLVYNAILRENRLPGGSVCLVPERPDKKPADEK